MFNPFGQPQTYDDIERRRQAGYGLMQGGSQAGSPLGALASIFGGLMSRNADKHQTRMAADEKTAAIEKRAQFGQRLLSGMGDNPEMKLVADLLNSGIPEYQQMGVERALAANQPKAAQGIAATDFLTQYGDKFDGTPEQFATMAEDGIVTGQELAGLKRKQDPKAQLELERIQAQIAKEKALAERAGRAPAGPAPSEWDRTLAGLTPEEQALARRIKAGLAPKAAAPKDPKEVTNDAGMNPRQQSGANMVRKNIVSYVSTLTGIPQEEVLAMSDEDIAAAVENKGDRWFQGKFMGAIGDALGMNQDIAPFAKGAGVGQALVNNPSGAITAPDFQAGEAMMPNSRMESDVQANLIRNILAASSAGGGVGGASARPPSKAKTGDPLIDKYLD